MPEDVEQSHEPHDRLTRMCDAMADAFRAHPEHQSTDKAICFIDDGERGGLVLLDYEDYAEAMAHLLQHVQAIFKANGKTMDIMFLGEDGINRVG